MPACASSIRRNFAGAWKSSTSTSRCSGCRFSTLPGDSLRNYFTSQAAKIPGSYNLAGMSDPVIDALVDKIIAADSRPALVTACKALDRVVRAGRYWVPHWYKASHWIAYWDVFGRPPTKPRFARGVPETWWFDRERATKNQRAG